MRHMTRLNGRTLRLSLAERVQLAELANALDRNPSDLLRHLLRQEHARRFGSTPGSNANATGANL